MFLSFDGIDGTGKTTQIERLCDWLRDAEHDVVLCRDPGSTAVGEGVRQILLHGDAEIGRRSEMLLYMAARAQLVDEVIRPALAANKIVVSDRYVLANLVYQGHAGGLDVDAIRRVGQVATDRLEPDAVLLLDMSPEAADRRLSRELDRMERQGTEYRQRLRAGFLAEAKSDRRIHVVDANQSVDEVQADIRQIVKGLLDAAG